MRERICVCVFLILLISASLIERRRGFFATSLSCCWANRRRQGTSLVFLSSQLLLAQNNPYDRVAYFGLVYSGLLQCFGQLRRGWS